MKEMKEHNATFIELTEEELQHVVGGYEPRHYNDHDHDHYRYRDHDHYRYRDHDHYRYRDRDHYRQH